MTPGRKEGIASFLAMTLGGKEGIAFFLAMTPGRKEGDCFVPRNDRSAICAE